jgi:hypothetical protein
MNCAAQIPNETCSGAPSTRRLVRLLTVAAAVDADDISATTKAVRA